MDDTLHRIQRHFTPRNARLALTVIALLSLGFGLALRNVRLDHDFERFFPTDDPELDRYLAFRERFGNDNDFLLIAAGHAPSVFQGDFLRRVDGLAEDLRGLPDVVSVTSPTDLEDVRVTPAGVFRVPWLRLDNDTLLALDSARVWRDDRMRENFFSADGDALLVVMLTAPDLSKERSDSLLLATEAVLAGSGIDDLRVAGRIHGQYYYIQKMLRELVLFFTASVLLLAIFLAITFRAAWGVLVPIGVVALTVLWQVGLMTLMGQPITVLTMLLPTILFVVGMSDVVHIVERYIEALRLGRSRTMALAVSFREVGLATLLTSVTTAIGFGTLISSSIPPIREFGIFTAIGVGLALVLAFTLLPAVLVLVPTPVRARERALGWQRGLAAVFRWVLRNRKGILAAFAVLAVASFGMLFRLKVNNFLLEDWPEDDPHKVDFHYFEDHFGGVRPFEMEVRVTAPGRDVWDLDVLRQTEVVQDHLEQEYGVGAVLSPVTVIKSLNQAFNGGSAEFFRIPEDSATVRRLVKRAALFAGRQGLDVLVSEDGRTARISGRMRDAGGHVHRGLNATLDSLVAARTDPQLVAFHQTGMAYLIDRNNEKLSGQLIGGLSVAFLIIGGIMAWVFRDPRMTLIALVPNVIPLLFVGGFMGLVGIDIKVSTAIIFTIAFGIAVDDTIHMLGKLRIELAKGRTVPYAMKRAFFSAGKAVTVTSIMLCSGFISLVFSDFASVFYMGLLVSITLAMAVVADLLLLPVLVLYFLRRR
ncbi:MAG: MMPL family transporter [Flavobacteriales bacterium]|nr:MMPL family transporter [Flavobacteriales bacterium]